MGSQSANVPAQRWRLFIFAWPHYLKRDATAVCARNEPRISCVIVAVVSTVLEDMAESGEEAPTPLASRTYSGKFALRIPPEKHRELAIEAAEQHVSLNQLVVSRL